MNEQEEEYQKQLINIQRGLRMADNALDVIEELTGGATNTTHEFGANLICTILDLRKMQKMSLEDLKND